MRSFFRPLFILLSIPLVIFIIIWGCGAFVAWQSRQYTRIAPSELETQSVAVIFGAGLKKQGEVGGVLQGRLDGALALYNAKKVTKLLLSGDNIAPSYDEVTAMENYVLAHHVPMSAILEDRKGISTYDSCYHLAHTFNLKKVILVTNEYHMPRAIYTCRALGVDATGLATPNFTGYENTSGQRESLATIKMFIDLYIAPPKAL